MPKLMATPSWWNPKNIPAMKTRVKNVKETAATIFSNQKLIDTVANLMSRWMDEREYEDFADYENVLKPLVEKHGAKFVKGTKRPFGFECTVDEVHYLVKLTANGDYTWSRLAFKE